MPSHETQNATAGEVTVFVLGLCLVSIIVFYVQTALWSPPSFDGGLNLNVARSLLEGTGYGSYYNGFRLFPIETQTNAPYVFPAALAYGVLGVGLLSSQVVNLGYVVLFALALYVALRRRERPAVALLAVVLAVQAPGMAEYAMNGYGEVPALAFLFAALAPLARALERGAGRRAAALALLGGVALSLSFLTKTVALIWVLPVSGLFALLALGRPGRWRLLAALALGLAGPVLVWEAYRLLSLGGLDAYVGWWMPQIGEILSQSGVESELQDTPGVLAKGWTHLGLLAAQTGTPWPLLLLFWLLPAPVVLAMLGADLRAGRYGRLLVLGSVAGVAAAYALWWLFVTPTEQAWLRRIMNGLVLQEVTILLVATACARAAWSGAALPRRVPRMLPLLLVPLLALPLAALGFNGQLVFRSAEPPPAVAAEVDVAEAVAALPADARLFGKGWWQAPVVALLSGRRIDDIETWSPEAVRAGPGSYLVWDRYALALAPGGLEELRRLYALEPVFRSDGGAVFRILPVQPEALPSDRLQRVVDLGTEDYPHVAGVHPREAGYRWATPEVTVTLERRSETRVAAGVTLVEGVIGLDGGSAPDGGPVMLRLSIPGCAEAELPVRKPGAYRIEAPITCPATPEPGPVTVRLSLNSRIDPARAAPDKRVLGFLVQDIGVWP